MYSTMLDVDSDELDVVQADTPADPATTLAHQGSGQLHMLTTVDNPFNPFIDYDKWNAYDEAQGYYTSNFLARVVVTSSEISEADQDLAIENAIDEILKENVLGIYRKVSQT